jgi:ABC-type molybdate transport system permease subunit
MTPSQIAPVTFPLVAQCLNQLRHHAPHQTQVKHKNMGQNIKNIFVRAIRPLSSPATLQTISTGFT